MGVAAFLISIGTLAAAAHEARKENVFKKIPVSGVIVSLLMLAGWTGVYVCGWIFM